MQNVARKAIIVIPHLMGSLGEQEMDELCESVEKSRIYYVEVCSDDDCLHHGEYEEDGWDESGLHPRYPYCYLARKKLDSSVQNIPEWCPLPHSFGSEHEKMLSPTHCPVCGAQVMRHFWCIDEDCGWDSAKEERENRNKYYAELRKGE